MKAYALVRHGGPGALRPAEIPTPEPGHGEVRVRLRAIGVNYAEVLSRKGMYGWAPRRPYTLGMEGAGEIDAVGVGVERAIGEAVIVGTQHGCYAEYVVVPQARALPTLAELSLEENAAFGVNAMTAWVALHEMARLRAADRVIVTAAGGGVGTMAVQFAARFGCEVIGMAGSDEKLERVRALGASQTVNYRRPDFAGRFEEAVGNRGVDVVLEVVGGEVYRRCLDSLAPFGRVVVAGFAGLDLKKWNPFSVYRTLRDMPRASVQTLARGSRGLLATHIGYLLDDPVRLRAVWSELVDFSREHHVRPIVGATYGFGEMAEAHRFMESRQSLGKIVVLVP
jgi:NADPH:quinone reductase